ncbi:hypothetical protein INT43_002026 [Umbelopsis isabellina]|uniref:Uncharacterized protein n=1 Tax=Mortierella isabellina TaxID=91625 RepID=A0A8H7PTY0_MORIS|nr:hypothetical protein INT43_002026 [Umbelopsis isabellina]
MKRSGRYPLQRARLWWSSLMPMAKDAVNRQPFDNSVGVQQISEMFKVLSAYHKHQLSKEAKHQVAVDALHKSFGFKLRVQPSNLPGAGNGVFLSGTRERGHIVCLYPDGLAVDAKNTGLSSRVHRSLHKRDNWPGAIITSDVSWLTKHPINPLAIGQIVNNNKDPNVRYQEIDLPSTFSLELRQYIPNLYLTDQSIENNWRIVALITTRKVQDEELFSTYFESVY